MPTPSSTILFLEAQLSLLYAIALHFESELSNLYHELFMKSLKDDDTRKINLDDIQKERRAVEDEINWRVSSVYDKEEKLRAKGEVYLELYEKGKTSVQSILPFLCGGGENQLFLSAGHGGHGERYPPI